ncbi:MAG TPA: hemolysin III family protein [Tepidiformaceae bacterium]|jgi:hemolysin III
MTSGPMPPRPVLRGVSHLVAAIIAPFALIVLLSIAASPRAYVGASVFGAGLILLFGTSASYHLLPWPSAKALLKRADHATIFVFIAATYTPFCLMVFGDSWGIPLLVAVWSAAALGVVLKVAWPEAPRWLGVGLYLGVGWLAVVAGWPLAHRAPGLLLGLVAAGLLFSLGSVVYALRRPDPFPRVFGYHEIFHLLVIAGVAINYGLIAGDVLRR